MQYPFAPYPPCSEGDNEDQIAQLDEQIRNAASRRQYDRAAELQAAYDFCLQVRQYYVDHPDQTARLARISAINDRQKDEETQLLHRYAAQLDVFLEEAHQRLAEIEQTHEDRLAKLDVKVNDPRFSALRISPTIQAMVRAEQFYSKQRSFKVASGYRQQASVRAHEEIAERELGCEKRTDAIVREIETDYIHEKVSLQAKFEMDTLRVKKALRVDILALQNRFLKIRHPHLKEREAHLVPPDASKTLYDALDQKYRDFVIELGFPPHLPSQTPSPHKIKLPATRTSTTPRSPRVTRSLTKTMGRRTLAMTI
jgi:hypothetical protein